jgi:hypothetical protein
MFGLYVSCQGRQMAAHCTAEIESPLAISAKSIANRQSGETSVNHCQRMPLPACPGPWAKCFTLTLSTMHLPTLLHQAVVGRCCTDKHWLDALHMSVSPIRVCMLLFQS